MKILIVIDWFLPGTLSGGPVRSYANLIDHLNEEFEFLVVTRDTDFGLNQPYDNITSNTWIEFNDYTKVFYVSKENVNSKFLKELFRNINYDMAYINGIYSWYFSILPIILLKSMTKRLMISARGMLNPQAFTVKGFKKKLFLKIAVLFNLYDKVVFHATNKDEAKYIREIVGKGHLVKIAPNLPRKLKSTFHHKTEINNPVKFINVARISIEKGTLIMLNAIGKLNKALILDLYGPIHDQDYWLKCQDVISRLPTHIKVNYKGIVPSEKIPETLKAYDFFVLLSEGENFGHAIIEALSCGLPVLISDQTPWKDLKTKEIGWDVDITNQKEIILAFQKALRISKDDYLLWSRAAYEFAEKFANDPVLLEKNKALFSNLK